MFGKIFGATPRSKINQQPVAEQLRPSLPLPTELTQEIALLLPPRGRIALAHSSRSLRTQLALYTPDAIKTLLLEKVRNVKTTPQAFNAMLRMQNISEHRRGELLAELAQQLYKLPRAEKTQMQKAIFDMVKKLPIEHRADPLAKIAHELYSLPESDMPEAFGVIFDEVISLPPEHRGRPLAELPGLMRCVMDSERLATCKSIIEASGGIPEEYRRTVIAGLASLALGRLSGSTLQIAFNCVLNATKELPPDYRREPLVNLVFAIDRSDFDQPSGLRELTKVTNTLAIEQRAWILNKLDDRCRRTLPSSFPSARALAASLRSFQ